MMTKKTKLTIKITALVLALALIGGLIWFACSLLGNPISYLITYNAVLDYVEEHYADTDYVVDYRGYDFKTGGYSAYISSPTKLDEHFVIYMSGGGKIINDGYDTIENKWNVATRLGMEYRKRVEAILDSGVLPYELDITYGDLEFDYEEGTTAYPEALTRADLENNRLYDVAELGRTNGEVVLYVVDENLSAENATAILLEVRRIFDTAGLPFHRINFIIRQPRDENGTWGDSVRLDDFLYTDIYEENMLTRVSAALKQD